MTWMNPLTKQIKIFSFSKTESFVQNVLFLAFHVLLWSRNSDSKTSEGSLHLLYPYITVYAAA